MRHLEIKTNKRLLIVEYPNDKSFQDDLSFYRQFKIGGFEQYFVKIICSGSQLTEDIANGFQYENMRVAHNGECLSAIEEFKFHISNHGYHWGENPMGNKPELSDARYAKEREFIENNPDEMVFGDHYADWSMWQEAESQTFNPSKCIIFEIL
ncbi:hypothetical protein [Chryseobacterium indologenes]|uniref:hypothetical protein n=1 Tax=Chryseobacterium indologenes TaxID=253 RepID=UPI0030184EDE